MRSLYLILFCFVCLAGSSLFAQSDYYIVSDINITGNDKTNENVILRELNFAINDTISKIEIEDKMLICKNNLLKTTLFNFVKLDLIVSENNLKVEIAVEERWYYWAYPIFEHADRNLSSFLYYRDLSKINYGAAFDWYNFRGKNETLRFKARLGYKEHYAISYNKTGFGKTRNSGFWISANYFRQKKTICNIVRNKPVYQINDNQYVKNAANLGVEYSYRPKLNYIFDIGVKYKSTKLLIDIADSWPRIEPFNYTYNYVNPKFRFRFDNRNNIAYPTEGVYFEIKALCFIENTMFDIDKSISVNLQYNTNLISEKLFFRTEIASKQLFYHAFGTILFDEKLEFFKDFTIRGYEYFYFPGSSLNSVKNTFSYKLSSFKIHNLPDKLPKEFSKTYSVVYLDVFADFAYTDVFADMQNLYNPLNENLIYSFGAGVTLETYYDRLFQFHIVYNGYFNKMGIFVEYKTPIYKTF